MQRVNVDFPLWMVKSLDREARRLGVTRQSIIKVWIAEKLEQQPKASRLLKKQPQEAPRPGDRAGDQRSG